MRVLSFPSPSGRRDQMTAFIGRREFITLIGGAAAAWPRGVLAQATKRRTVIAWLWAASQSGADEYVRAGKLLPPFLKGMQEVRYTEGRVFALVTRLRVATSAACQD